MTYNGKEVLTPETFSYSKAQVGDFVSQEVVDNVMDLLPPACMTSECAQMGEPYSTRLDPESGRYRDTFATFKRITSGRDGIWQYCGHCFCGENVERGTVPPFVRLALVERDEQLPTIKTVGPVPDLGILIQALDHKSKKLVSNRGFVFSVNQNGIICDNRL